MELQKDGELDNIFDYLQDEDDFEFNMQLFDDMTNPFEEKNIHEDNNQRTCCQLKIVDVFITNPHLYATTQDINALETKEIQSTLEFIDISNIEEELHIKRTSHQRSITSMNTPMTHGRLSKTIGIDDLNTSLDTNLFIDERSISPFVSGDVIKKTSMSSLNNKVSSSSLKRMKSLSCDDQLTLTSSLIGDVTTKSGSRKG